MVNGKLAAIGVGAVASALVGLGATPSLAGTVTPASCQVPAARAFIVEPNGYLYSMNCSGSYYPNVTGSRFDAGGWSGYIMYNGGRSFRYYCDWNSFPISGTVTKVFLSPTKGPWC